jgi:hypothetical protein
VPNINPAEFSSVANLYFVPFSKAWRLLGLKAACPGHKRLNVNEQAAINVVPVSANR